MFLKRLLFLFCLLPLGLSAQQGAEAGIMIGGSFYQGDLAPSPFYAGDLHLAIGGTYRYLLSPNFAIRGNANFTKLSGADINVPRYRGQTRLWEFTGNLLEFNVSGEYHPFALSRYSEVGLFRRQYTPYLGLGLGITFSDAKVKTRPEGQAYKEDDENTSTFLNIPVTLGIRFDISEKFILQMEGGSRYVLSDYLDSVSQIGGKNAKDWYIVFGFSFMYNIDSEREDINQ